MIRTVADDDISQRRRNSIHRFNLRQIEKNRFPVKCGCVICGEGFLCRGIEEYIQRQYYLGRDKKGEVRHVCWGCSLDHKVKVAARTLYHLVSAIPVAERDRNEIYPSDFRGPRIPLWREDRERLPGLGLRDYAEPARLLFRFGRYDSVIRQKAASPVRNVLITSDVVGRLTPSGMQQTLKRAGRLYRNGCWFPKITGVPFDHRRRAYLCPEHAPLPDRRDRVVYLLPRSHANLASTQAAYNGQWGSYLNNNRLTRTLREQRSLNIPRENIVARNNVIANLERDFAPRERREAA